LWNCLLLKESCWVSFSYYLCFYIGICASKVKFLLEVLISCVLSLDVFTMFRPD
jgi:hypothetical protein